MSTGDVDEIAVDRPLSKRRTCAVDPSAPSPQVHAQRNVYNLHETAQPPLATEALGRIQAPYAMG